MPLGHVLKREASPQPRNIIGPRLRALRKAAVPRISQEDLCGRVARDGVTLTRTQVAKIESGRRPVFDYEAAALAKALGAELGALFAHEQDRPRGRSR